MGASAAGLAAVETLRREGYDGTLTLVGDEPHAPYDRPPLSKQILASEWEHGRLAAALAGDLDALDLDLRLGTAATGLDLDGRDGAARRRDAGVVRRTDRGHRGASASAAR